LLLPLALALPPVSAPASASPVRPVTEAELGALLRSTHRGPLMVNFFATWCAPCAAELPMLQAVAAAHPNADALFVSLDEAADTAKVQGLVDRIGLASPVVHLQARDPSGTMARLVSGWPESIPVTMVMASSGEEASRFVGIVRSADIAAALEAPVTEPRP
jgi:thiol-disulfide isomerase/thioredoxin